MDFLYMLFAVALILIVSDLYKSIFTKIKAKILAKKLKKEIENKKDKIKID